MQVHRDRSQQDGRARTVSDLANVPEVRAEIGIDCVPPRIIEGQALAAHVVHVLSRLLGFAAPSPQPGLHQLCHAR